MEEARHDPHKETSMTARIEKTVFISYRDRKERLDLSRSFCL